MVIATPQPAMAAGNFIGGADRYPLYVVNDHTAYAVHFVASGLTPNTTYKVWARFCPEPYPGGGNQWGYTWNADTQQWIQEREDNELQGHFTSDASGVIPGGGWLYVKYGCEGNVSGDNLVISMEPVGVSSATLNSETSTTPSVTVLDADTQGSWIHNGVATGHHPCREPAAARAPLRASANASPSSQGAPINSKGASVPRPSETLVPSIKHVPG